MGWLPKSTDPVRRLPSTHRDRHSVPPRCSGWVYSCSSSGGGRRRRRSREARWQKPLRPSSASGAATDRPHVAAAAGAPIGTSLDQRAKGCGQLCGCSGHCLQPPMDGSGMRR